MTENLSNWFMFVNVDYDNPIRMERELRPSEKGDLLGRAVRQFKAGFQKILRLFKHHHWISRQENTLIQINNQLNWLIEFADKELKRVGTIDMYYTTNYLDVINPICESILRKVPHKINKAAVEKLQAAIQKFYEDRVEKNLTKSNIKNRGRPYSVRFGL